MAADQQHPARVHHPTINQHIHREPALLVPRANPRATSRRLPPLHPDEDADVERQRLQKLWTACIGMRELDGRIVGGPGDAMMVMSISPTFRPGRRERMFQKKCRRHHFYAVPTMTQRTSRTQHSQHHPAHRAQCHTFPYKDPART